ncbi:MAG: hypothetical protein Q8M16_00415 [Pirellulaceae bacterium]|nr:hypothetical protein [Pirellulaceae bacterium]
MTLSIIEIRMSRGPGNGCLSAMMTYGSAGNPSGRSWLQRGSNMSMIQKHLIRFLRDESGPTAIEYAIMASLIVVVCATAIASIGVRLIPWYQATANVLR